MRRGDHQVPGGGADLFKPWGAKQGLRADGDALLTVLIDPAADGHEHHVSDILAQHAHAHEELSHRGIPVHLLINAFRLPAEVGDHIVIDGQKTGEV